MEHTRLMGETYYIKPNFEVNTPDL